MSKPKAILFDFNGVIIDDEAIHARLSQAVLQDEGLTITWKDYNEIYLGFDDKGLFNAVYQSHERKLSPDKLNQLVEKKNQLYQQALADNLPLFAGVIPLINLLQGNYLLALVSGALRREIDFVLAQTGLAKFFSIIISAEDTTECKPDPEGYLQALTQLRQQNPDLLAGDCLAIEDSHAGIQAAKSAGMKVIAISHTYTALSLSAADYVVENLSEIEKILRQAPKVQDVESQRAEQLLKFVDQAQRFQLELNPNSVRRHKPDPPHSLKQRLKKLSGKN